MIFRILFVGVLAGGALLFFALRQDQKQMERDTLTIGTEKFFVEKVRTSVARARGLGGREDLCERCGMLFLFDRAGPHAFWMKDMRFSLDILWIRGGVIVYSVQKIAPSDVRTFVPPVNAEMVVELTGGTMERLRLTDGMSVFLEES